jgi:DNA replication licensing factor MCM6
MRERELNTLYVNFDHLMEYDQVRQAFIRAAAGPAAATPPLQLSHAPAPSRPQSLAADIVDAYYRMDEFLRKACREFVREHLDTYAERDDGGDKEFWVSFYNLEHSDRLRSLRSDKIGALTQFVGTVTRTTEVRPELFLGTFRCLRCMGVVRGVEQQFKYTQPTRCPQPTCANL